MIGLNVFNAINEVIGNIEVIDKDGNDRKLKDLKNGKLVFTSDEGSYIFDFDNKIELGRIIIDYITVHNMKVISRSVKNNIKDADIIKDRLHKIQCLIGSISNEQTRNNDLFKRIVVHVERIYKVINKW